MDEQTIQPSNHDVSADGAVEAGYQEEALPAMPEATSSPNPEEVLKPDGASLDDEGNVSFGDEFFGDPKEKPEDEQPTVNWYTDEELSQIPYQQWEVSRLNGDMPLSKVLPIVQAQMRQTQVNANAQRYENVPLPPEISEVKPYTPHELSEEAMKLACEKLGIKEAEDFDGYEPEHQAAYNLATNELLQKRNAEIVNYQTAFQTWQENSRYQAELSRRPDFIEFNNWVEGQCRQRGATIGQLNALLYDTVKKNGNNFRIVPQYIEGLYREYQQAKQSARPKQASRNPGISPSGIRRVPRSPSPAVLEGTGGNSYTGKPSIRAEAFGRMTEDEQVNALMNLGLV